MLPFSGSARHYALSRNGTFSLKILKHYACMTTPKDNFYTAPLHRLFLAACCLTSPAPPGAGYKQEKPVDMNLAQD